ncbi:PD-(D/E)XK nuclease family protein [Streptomyces rochei]|uniref:PD-(D/E)XK nuclease family protein n=1 Tax=Streptomyces rochei TaxID=1928 RepID=UPI00368EA049
MSKSYNVSTSEVATFLTCKQRWMYAHHPSYNLEPRTLGIALTRGLIGHSAMEVYYKSIKEGTSHTDSVALVQENLAKESVQAMMRGDSDKSLMITQLGLMLKQYFEESQWILMKYDLLGVENLVTAPLPDTDNINFAGRIDLMLGIAKGPNKGEVIPWDHKFTYNFWPEMSIKLNAQISNYVWVVREMGMRSRKGIISMSRYRENAQEKFKQEEVPTNSEMRDLFIKNHVVAAKQIVELKQKPTVSIENGVTRSTSKFNCEYCPFAELCYTEAQGLDSTLMRKANFRKNSYGYDNVLDVE